MSCLPDELARTLYLEPDGPSVWRALWREDGRILETAVSLDGLRAWAEDQGAAVIRHVDASLARFAARRPLFAGLSLDRPCLMGIINVTPDSFSDGGRHLDPGAAIAHGLALREAGAEILDVGGELTRPGASPVSPDEEARRVLPVVRGLAERGIVVSIDSRHAAVMAAAVESGASILNDVTALTGDPQSLRIAAGTGAAIVLMHMQGEPQSMQSAPAYAFAPLDVYDFLADRLAACQAAGIAADRLCVDPGIGFGKTVDHNLQILAHLGLLQGLGVPVLLGVSRKRFIATLSQGESPVPTAVPGRWRRCLPDLTAACRC